MGGIFLPGGRSGPPPRGDAGPPSTFPLMLVGLVAAGLAAIVAVVLGVRLQAAARRTAELEAERARLAASLSARERDLQALAPYRAAVDGAGDWIWATDGEGRLTFSNAAGRELLGRDDLAGRSLEELT